LIGEEEPEDSSIPVLINEFKEFEPSVSHERSSEELFNLGFGFI